ncbi:NACHT domain-containing protein [Rickettsia bellii]|uniref:NACHT domain protein n=1 Tax=Rickettsia bellii str. RML Mogi TaxID=1359194 RepID=A0A0F3QJK7_RICBE|nr:NACHT domain-containing protein [Rickettsia bellii]KJV92733.1 NACHT domain protein [Rickettsia bellii str. RML Mogi]
MQEKTKAFNVLKTLYSFQDTLPKLIEDEQIKALSLDEYYIKLQILLSEDNDSVKAALHDKVTGEKKPVEIENIFKAIDVENRIRELLEKNYQVREEIINDIIKPLIEEENKLNLLYRNIPNKSESEIKYIAESINRIQADVGKVLLLGGAGIGKTTLMHYLSYKWGKDNLWNDKFDYVFRIKLKELLNENWSREYEAKELRQNKLACFIHYCLNLENIEPHEIINISNKDRVLLLLDGYDEVAFLSQDNRDYRDIMEAVFQYKNVIMSSRPNAITENINNKFERKVENTGWDSEGIKKYVYKSFEYDKEFGTPLKSFLDTHSQIKEICEAPINTAIICLIWSDQEIRQNLQTTSNENFNISRLYSEIINWLNNRHLAKNRHKYKNKTEANNHLKNIMSFLEQIAYESLSIRGKLVESKLVESKKNTLDIDEVIEQGLLRREGQNYQFIHLTFQEFLAARHLKNQLLDNYTKSKAASFYR